MFIRTLITVVTKKRFIQDVTRTESSVKRLFIEMSMYSNPLRWMTKSEILSEPCMIGNLQVSTEYRFFVEMKINLTLKDFNKMELWGNKYYKYKTLLYNPLTKFC